MFAEVKIIKWSFLIRFPCMNLTAACVWFWRVAIQTGLEQITWYFHKQFGEMPNIVLQCGEKYQVEHKYPVHNHLYPVWTLKLTVTTMKTSLYHHDCIHYTNSNEMLCCISGCVVMIFCEWSRLCDYWIFPGELFRISDRTWWCIFKSDFLPVQSEEKFRVTTPRTNNISKHSCTRKTHNPCSAYGASKQYVSLTSRDSTYMYIFL